MEIRTIFILMMENRSFDHLLGYLALEGRDVEGLSADPAWLDRVANPLNGSTYRPFPLTDPYSRIPADPPHGRDLIPLQMGKRVGDVFPMKGFVESYTHAKEKPVFGPKKPPPVMGYFTADQAPVTDFLARNFAVCDHWHAPLPAGRSPTG